MADDEGRSKERLKINLGADQSSQKLQSRAHDFTSLIGTLPPAPGACKCGSEDTEDKSLCQRR